MPPEVKLTRKDESGDPLKVGAEVKLHVEVLGGQASSLQWKRNDVVIEGETGYDYNTTASKDKEGTYQVEAKIGDEAVVSNREEVKLAGADSDSETDTELPPEFHLWFAIVSLLAAIAIAGVILWKPASTVWQVSKNDWKGTDGDSLLAASLSVPLTVIGGAAVAAGAWMAVVEWRGRFRETDAGKEPAGRGLDINVGEVIKAIGNLRGAALVMVVGAILMLGSAWVAHSSVDNDQTGATGATGSTGDTGNTGTTGAPGKPGSDQDN